MILLLQAWAIAYIVWLFFLVVMQFRQARSAGLLTDPVIRFHARLTEFLGVGIYGFLNLVVASIVFFDPPREFEFTKRCRRYIAGERQCLRFEWLLRYRAGVAGWLCREWLDPYDIKNKGKHC